MEMASHTGEEEVLPVVPKLHYASTGSCPFFFSNMRSVLSMVTLLRCSGTWRVPRDE